jgi:hypothetical protein
MKVITKDTDLLLSRGFDRDLLKFFPTSITPIGDLSPYRNLRGRYDCVPFYVRKTWYSGDNAFFCDDDLSWFHDINAHGLFYVSSWLDTGRKLVIPKEGFLDDEIKMHSPVIHAEIESTLYHLFGE